MVNYTPQTNIAFLLFPIFCCDSLKKNLLSGPDSFKYASNITLIYDFRRLFFFSRTPHSPAKFQPRFKAVGIVRVWSDRFTAPGLFQQVVSEPIRAGEIRSKI